MYVPVILGTAREGRESGKVARFVLGEARKFGFESEVLDVRDYGVPATDRSGGSPAAKRLAEKVSRADALIFVSPEYNHGYPGELKMMVDLLVEEYAGKPAAICAVSSGAVGGARMVEQLRLVLIQLRVVNVPEAVYFPEVGKLFDADGEIIDRESFSRRANRMLADLSWHAGALKAARGKK
ncbi:MAG: NAD(P)H-dependent oxidoreductase [Candidatus ainarchaeum sp.]|nr:NAD(P)H-dependent oxidoreductase [Candidatus ainarchaeum sp.]